MKTELYFCLDLTEDEHFIVNNMLQELCANNNMELVYYRKIKTGHIPCIREVKILFNNRYIFNQFIAKEHLWKHMKRWENGKLVDWIKE